MSCNLSDQTNVLRERTEEMLEEPACDLDKGALLPTLCATALLGAGPAGQAHAPTALRHLMTDSDSHREQAHSRLSMLTREGTSSSYACIVLQHLCR